MLKLWSTEHLRSETGLWESDWVCNLTITGDDGNLGGGA